MKRLFASASVVLLALVFNAAGQEYPIKFGFEYRAGDQHHIEGKGKTGYEMSLSRGGQAPNIRKYKQTWSAVADITILKVDAAGHPVEAEAMIREIFLVKDGMSSSPLPKDSLVKARLENGQEVYTHNGKPIPADVRGVVALLLELRKEHATQDEIFGTNKPRKPGDQWSANSTLLARQLSSSSGKIDPEDITMDVTFDKVVGRRSEKHLRLIGKGTVNNIKADSSMVPGLKLTDGSTTMLLTAEYPADQSTPARVESLNTSLRFVSEPQENNGAVFVMDSVVEVSVERSRFKRK